MKILKKMVVAITAMSLIMGGLLGCKADEDDPFELIQKTNNKNFSVNHKNDTKNIQRGYKATNLNHSGGTVRIEFDATTQYTGTMGFIWEQETNKDGTKNFYICGVNYKNNNLQYYISKFENIDDIQAYNFGASKNAEAGKPKETKIVPGQEEEKDFKVISKYALPENKRVKIVIDVESSNTNNNIKQGKYNLNIYDGATYEEKNHGAPIETVEDISAKTGSNGDVEQGLLAVYANVYKDMTLEGSWQFLKDYQYALVEEE